MFPIVPREAAEQKMRRHCENIVIDDSEHSLRAWSRYVGVEAIHDGAQRTRTNLRPPVIRQLNACDVDMRWTIGALIVADSYLEFVVTIEFTAILPLFA